MSQQQPEVASPALPHAAELVRTQGEIVARGFAVLPAVYTPDDMDRLTSGLTSAIAAAENDGEAIRSRTGVVYAARNIIDLYPAAADVWRQPVLVDLLCAVLGPNFGLVRALFFDKPPDRTWSLAWHKDVTIAVRDNARPSASFSKPTHKAGVPHVEAPLELLESMLTLRIHLDDVTDENGPLRVIPASHRSGKSMGDAGALPESILVHRGDVLAMRPLLSHSSPNSHALSRRHRRILHLEFAGWATLPDGFAWHQFVPCRQAT